MCSKLLPCLSLFRSLSVEVKGFFLEFQNKSLAEVLLHRKSEARDQSRKMLCSLYLNLELLLGSLDFQYQNGVRPLVSAIHGKVINCQEDFY